MTYNPPPYQPPQGPLGYQSPQPAYYDGLAPARRAAVLCWVLGGLGLCCGACMSVVAFLAPMDKIAAQGQSVLSPEQQQALGNIDLAQMLKVLYASMGIAAIVISILLLILGVFVRRGSRGGIITTIVVFICIALVGALGVLSGLVEAAMGKSQGLLGALIWLVIGVVAGVAIHWLAQALRAVRAMGTNMQTYYQQFQQHPGFAAPPSYGYGYGYGAPPPAAPPPTQQQQSPGSMPPAPDQPGNPPPGNPQV